MEGEEEGEIVMGNGSQPTFADIAQGILPDYFLKSLQEELKFEKPSPVQVMVIEEIKRGTK